MAFEKLILILILPAGDPNVGFVHIPGGGREFQLSSQPVIDHRTVLLTPTPDRRVVDHEPAFGHHFLDVAKA